MLGDAGRQIVEGGEAALRSVGSELSELDDIGLHDLRERVHQALLGASRGRPSMWRLIEALLNREPPDRSDAPVWRGLQGLLGNETYSGDENLIIGAFPEGSAVRDIGDPLLEELTAPQIFLSSVFSKTVEVFQWAAPGLMRSLAKVKILTAIPAARNGAAMKAPKISTKSMMPLPVIDASISISQSKVPSATKSVTKKLS